MTSYTQSAIEWADRRTCSDDKPAPEITGERVLGWHILPGDMRLNNDHNGDNRLVKIGETLSVNGAIECCANGLHACKRAVDAIQYRPLVNSLIFCRVETWGDIDEQIDKHAARYRKVLWIVPPEQTIRVLVEWAMLCAKGALENERKAGREPDARSWGAIDATQKWLDGQITTEALKTAADAAYAAADAADAAHAAARAAARAAAYAAAYAADAAYAAYAARAAHNELLEKLLEQHSVYEYVVPENEAQ